MRRLIRRLRDRLGTLVNYVSSRIDRLPKRLLLLLVVLASRSISRWNIEVDQYDAQDEDNRSDSEKPEKEFEPCPVQPLH